jgi:dynein heavy chain
MQKLEAARASKDQALGDLELVQQQLKEVTDRLDVLSATFMKATEEKNAVEREAAACLNRLSLAERLVNGLSSENDRWELEVEKLNVQLGTLVGDTLLASAFVSYIGAFSAPLRLSLWKNTWTNDILSREIPLTPGITPLDMIANDASVAEWCMQGLPEDPMSVDNGAIISACTRWPLVIDPQLQGITWLKTRYDTSVPPSEEAQAEAVKAAKAQGVALKKPQDLIVIQMSQSRWMPKLLRAIQEVCWW